MSARTVRIVPDGNIIIISGYKVAQLARQAGLKATYSGAVGGWMLDAKRLPDLVAHLEYRNVRFELAGVTQKQTADTLGVSQRTVSNHDEPRQEHPSRSSNFATSNEPDEIVDAELVEGLW